MRIAIGGIHNENSKFNPVSNRLEDFLVLRDEELVSHSQFSAIQEVSSFDVLPTLYARAMSGGPIEASAYSALKDEYLTRLEACGRLDGLWLSMHGAASVRGMHDAEGDWLVDTRNVVGKDCIIVASYDLHGNLSPAGMPLLDALAAYRTAPHTDIQATHRRAVGMLRRALATDERPYMSWAPIPMLIPGERASTRHPLVAEVYREISALDRREGIWDASLLIGYPWADEPRVGATAVVVGAEKSSTIALAEALAKRVWEVRNELDFAVPHGSLSVCIHRGLGQVSRTATAIVADSGDNPGAGGVGDRADALKELLAQRAEHALVAGIAAPRAVAACRDRRVGESVRLSIGAQLDASSGPRVEVEGRILARLDRGDERQHEVMVRVGTIDIILTSCRRSYTSIADMRRMGVNPLDYRLIVVKAGYLPTWLRDIAQLELLALSDGAVAQDPQRFDYEHLGRPCFPLDRTFDWTPEAQVRSGLRGS